MFCFSKSVTKKRLTAKRNIKMAAEQNTTILCACRMKIGVDDDDFRTLWVLVVGMMINVARWKQLGKQHDSYLTQRHDATSPAEGSNLLGCFRNNSESNTDRSSLAIQHDTSPLSLTWTSAERMGVCCLVSM